MTIEKEPVSLAHLTDADLRRELWDRTAHERRATAEVIAALGEVDARRLYLAEGYSSLFSYCTQALHLSEHAAYSRIEAARAARKWPVVLKRIADGALHLTAVTLLSRHLTSENHEALLAAACHKSKRDIEEIVAAIRPQPAVPPSVRKLPAPTAPAIAAGVETRRMGADATPVPLDARVEHQDPPAQPPPRAGAIRPLAPAQYKVQFTVTRDTYEQLQEAQNLLRHRIPSGDIAEIFEQALALLVAQLRKAKHAAVESRARRLGVDHQAGTFRQR